MHDLSYQNLITKFFYGNNLISKKCERIESCMEYVSTKTANSTFIKFKGKILTKVTSLEVTFMKKWRESECNAKSFENANAQWLQRKLELPEVNENVRRQGRPTKDSFSNLSERSKFRRVAEFKDHDIEELLLAAAQAAKISNEKNLAHVLRLLCNGRNEVATEIRALKESRHDASKLQQISPIRGLTHLLDNRLSKAQYVNTRLLSKEFGANIFPAYNKVREAKTECRPPAKYLNVNDVCAELPLKQLLDHTAQRLLLLQHQIISHLSSKESLSSLEVILMVKWGFDGSSNQSQYNQKFNDSGSNGCDSNLFATSLVPLQLSLGGNNGTIIWKNITPGSSKWCRPLRLRFAKETPELTMAEKKSVEEEIQLLQAFKTSIAGIQVSVVYKMYLTMIDGKVLAVITYTKSNQRCCVCRATPKEFNDLSNISVRFKPNLDALKFGISVLHLWIRSFEWLLHVSYRKTVEVWQMRGTKLQNELKKRKRELQHNFFAEMGLRVDFPSSKGSGNTNNGPLARAAFAKPKMLSKILGIDEVLITRVATILSTLSCQLPIDENKFSDYCLQTAHRYIAIYHWFPMPPSIHKLLIHSKDIMLASELPLGVLAEDAGEACNKLYRHNRQFHSRKQSRRFNLMDVFNRAIDSSDPIVASFNLQKRLNSRRRKSIPTDVLALLKVPAVDLQDSDGSDDEEEKEFLLEELDSLNDLCLPEDTYYSECC